MYHWWLFGDYHQHHNSVLTLSWPAGHICPTYKESFKVHWDNSIPLFLHAAIYLEVSLFRWTSQNAFSRETAVYKWYLILEKTLCKWDICPTGHKRLSFSLPHLYSKHRLELYADTIVKMTALSDFILNFLTHLYDWAQWIVQKISGQKHKVHPLKILY